MRQAGLARVGLALEPANDWSAVENDHAHIAAFRAVENGFAMMRPDAKGLSLAVDPMGRELARGEYYTTDRLDTIALMPIQSLPTLYSRIGDVFAYASIIAISALTMLAFAPRLRRQQRERTLAPAHD
jgi:apolipoprotein N-acyltransferase